MVRENLQADVVREDHLALPILLVNVNGDRIQLCKQETSLTAPLIASDDFRNWTPIGNECLCILNRVSNNFLKFSMSGIVLQIQETSSLSKVRDSHWRTTSVL
jgi:hypothetical protein